MFLARTKALGSDFQVPEALCSFLHLLIDLVQKLHHMAQLCSVPGRAVPNNATAAPGVPDTTRGRKRLVSALPFQEAGVGLRPG